MNKWMVVVMVGAFAGCSGGVSAEDPEGELPSAEELLDSACTEQDGICRSTAFLEDLDHPCGSQPVIDVSCGERMRVCCPAPPPMAAGPKGLAPATTTMPTKVLAVLNDKTMGGDNHAMGDHHLAWHMARQWNRLDVSDVQWLASLGIKKKAAHQEGTTQNGMEFLAMHRAVLTMLRTHTGFSAANRALFDGWKRVPDPKDKELATSGPDSLAANRLSPGEDLEIPDELRKTIAACQDEPKMGEDSPLKRFKSDDEFGRFIETGMNKSSLGDLMGLGAGSHNFLHNRFSQPGSSNDLGDPQKNFKNQIFWRLHGWIDRCWTKYRNVVGADDETDTAYIAALARGATEMHLPKAAQSK